MVKIRAIESMPTDALQKYQLLISKELGRRGQKARNQL